MSEAPMRAPLLSESPDSGTLRCLVTCNGVKGVLTIGEDGSVEYQALEASKAGHCPGTTKLMYQGLTDTQFHNWSCRHTRLYVAVEAAADVGHSTVTSR